MTISLSGLLALAAEPATTAHANAPHASLNAATAFSGTITTVAGGVGGPARARRVGVGSVCGVAFRGGRLYAVESSLVRRVSTSTDWLTTPVGTGLASGPAADGSPAIAASLTKACGVAVDSAGNLLITETGKNRVRVVAAATGTFYGQPMTAGDIYTIAGTATAGYSGDGGPAVDAELRNPSSVATDAAGNVLIADKDNSRIRVVAAATGTFYGQPMTAGDIYTIAGTATAGYSGDGGPATSAKLNYPYGITVDASGNVVLTDTGNRRVRAVAAATGTFYGQAMTAGDIYTIAGDGIYGYSGDGGPATVAAVVPRAIALDAAGNVLVSDSDAYSHRIRAVAAATGTFYGQAMTAGDIYTIAGDGVAGQSGDGGPATSAEIGTVTGIAVDGTGNVTLADPFWARRVRIVVAVSGTYYGQAMTAGDIYTVAGNGSYSYSGDGGPATKAQINLKWSAIRFDHFGNLVIADTFNLRIRVVAAAAGTFYGRSMTAGDIYTVAGDGRYGYSGDGGRATKAQLDTPTGVAVDGAGNLIIADPSAERIRVVAVKTGIFYGKSMTAGYIYTVAGNGAMGYSGDGGPATKAELYGPTGVTVDHAGNLVISDRLNSRIRVVAAKSGTFYGKAMTKGYIYTVAGDGADGYAGDGGPATKAGLYFPEQTAVDSSGNLVIADTYSQRVRVVAVQTGTFYRRAMTKGYIYTVAGDGVYGYSGDGVDATQAEINFPEDVALDSSGNILVADSGNYRLRVVAAKSGTFYGQAMTAKDIYTIAGSGTSGYSGDGGPATQADLVAPEGVAVNASGQVAVADSPRVRIFIG